MQSRKIVINETLIVAVGEAVCVLLMLGVFALLGRWNLNVILGALIGFVLAVGNFFFMAMGACLASDKAESQNVNGGRVLMRFSYILRLGALFVLLLACAKSKLCNPAALAVPLLFVRPVLTISEFFRKKGDKV
jgi:hypothetical protein